MHVYTLSYVADCRHQHLPHSNPHPSLLRTWRHMWHPTWPPLPLQWYAHSPQDQLGRLMYCTALMQCKAACHSYHAFSQHANVAQTRPACSHMHAIEYVGWSAAHVCNSVCKAVWLSAGCVQAPAPAPLQPAPLPAPYVAPYVAPTPAPMVWPLHYLRHCLDAASAPLSLCLALLRLIVA